MRAHARRRLGDRLVGLLPAVKAREPGTTERDLLPVCVWAPPWGDQALEPGVLALDVAGARLWRCTEGHGPPHLEAEIRSGWSVHVPAGRLALAQGESATFLALAVLGPDYDPWVENRPGSHRVAAALERALGSTPDVAPLVAIDQVGPTSPTDARFGVTTLTVVALVVAVAAAIVGFEVTERLQLDLVVGQRVSLAVGVLLAAYFTSRLSRPRSRLARDGWVGLCPDRLVHIQDRIVVLPWSAAQRYDDRRSGWVEVEGAGGATAAIPTVDATTRARVVATLDGFGLARRV